MDAHHILEASAVVSAQTKCLCLATMEAWDVFSEPDDAARADIEEHTLNSEQTIRQTACSFLIAVLALWDTQKKCPSLFVSK